MNKYIFDNSIHFKLKKLYTYFEKLFMIPKNIYYLFYMGVFLHF